MQTPIRMNNAGDMVVLIHQHERSRTLNDLVGVPVIASQQSRRHAPSRRFDIFERRRWNPMAQKFAPGSVRFWTPREHAIGWLDNTGGPVRQRGCGLSS